MLVEQLRVEERQLDGVTDRVDLPLETSDVLVANVGDLLEDELLDLFLGEELDRDVGPRVEQDVVADADRGVEERARQVRDILLVTAADDDQAIVAQFVLDLHDLARAVGVEHLDHVEGLVQDDLDAGAEGTFVEVGRGHHAHLAARGEHVEGAVVVRGEVDAEGGRRLRELLDLLGEGLDLVPFGPQGVGELLVLAHRLAELLAGLDELLLEERDLPRCVREPPTKQADLLLQELHLALELVDLVLVARNLLVVAGHLASPPHRASSVSPPPPQPREVARDGSFLSLTALAPGRLRPFPKVTERPTRKGWPARSLRRTASRAALPSGSPCDPPSDDRGARSVRSRASLA